MVCHRTFSPFSTSQRVGATAFVSTPPACGPRNCGQLAAERSNTIKRPRSSDAAFTLLCSFHAHLQPIDVLARGNEKQVAILAAESDVGRPRFRHVDVFDLLARLVEHGYAPAGEINVAFVVECHAVGTQFAEQPLVCERAVGLNVVSVGPARADVGDVKRVAVGRCR